MPGLRPPDEDRIPVAAPRPSRRARRPQHGVVDATGAGLIALVITIAFAVLGRWVGGLVGIPYAGAMLFGFAGAVAGLAAVIWRYRKL